MKEQGDLFAGKANARRSDPSTSHKAAAFVETSGEGAKLLHAVVEAVWRPENADGLICDEICTIIDGDRERWGSISPRLKTAKSMGYLVVKCDAFGKLTRTGRMGRQQEIHIRGPRRPEWL